MSELEFFALFKDVGIGILALGLLWQSMRGNSKTEAGLIGIIANLSSNIAASTAAITTLANHEKDTQGMVKSARRDHQAIINTLDDAEYGLGALAVKLDAVPEQTAVRVRDEIRDAIQSVKEKVVTVALQLDTLCNRLDDWTPKPTGVDINASTELQPAAVLVTGAAGTETITQEK